MFPILSAALSSPLLSGAAGAALSYIGGRNANSARAYQADVANAFSERMASTQYQRAVADMRAAGLNPILAATKGMTSAAPAGQQANVSDVVTPAVHSGQQTYSAHQSGKSQEQNRNIKNPLEEIAVTLAPVVAQGAKALAALPQTIEKIVDGLTSPKSSGGPAESSAGPAGFAKELMTIPKQSLNYFTSLPSKAKEAVASSAKAVIEAVRNPTPEDHKTFIPPAEWGYHPQLGKTIRKNYRDKVKKGIPTSDIVGK